MSASWDLLLVRTTKNRLNPDITRRKLKKIAESASRNQSLGFEARTGKLPEPAALLDEHSREEVYRYVVRLRVVKKTVRSQNNLDDKFAHILRVLSRCAGSEGWDVVPASPGSFSLAPGAGVSLPELPPISTPLRTTFRPPELTPEVLATFFGDIYERDAHIRIIHDAVRTCADTVGEVLSHVLLYGLPGGCKTMLCQRLKTWYEHGLPDSAAPYVLFTNNISTTKAGMENMLLDLADGGMLPQVLVVDEIEKQPLENLLCLNTVMSEGVITKLNAKVGHRREQARFTVIAICNDAEKLRNWQVGHIWSRFTHKLRCVRPSRELCERILEREALRLPGGKTEWAKMALSLGWDVLNQRDVREIKGHLDGRDRLLDGSWQMDKLAILKAAEEEDHATGMDEEKD